MPAPLAGRRIVVTRAERQSGGLQSLLEQEGAEVVLLPTIETAPPDSYAPLDASIKNAGDFDWLIVTSANAVRVLGERLSDFGLGPSAIRHLRIAAIGSATAAALAALGRTPDLVPERPIGEALADALAPLVTGKRVLLVRAAVARDVVPEALTRAGASVTITDAYQTVIPEGAGARARVVFGSGSPPDAVVFTSGSTVTHLLAVLASEQLVIPSSVACISIGPITSAAMRDAGLRVAAEAETADLPSLVAACVRLLGRKSAPL